ncbi:MAG: AMP-binding protein, partial [Cyanobacteria bacterium J06639_1]
MLNAYVNSRNVFPTSTVPKFSTVTDLLRSRSRERPDAVAFRFLADGQAELDCATYAALDRRARAIASALQKRNETVCGQRVLLLYPPGIDYVAAFFGCLYAGTIAVPAYPPRNRRHYPRIASILQDSGAGIALTNSDAVSQVRSLFESEPHIHDGQLTNTDDLSAVLADEWVNPNSDPSDLAFLQYTSGSTGTPKGVMVNHANVLYNAVAIQERFEDSDR